MRLAAALTCAVMVLACSRSLESDLVSDDAGRRLDALGRLKHTPLKISFRFPTVPDLRFRPCSISSKATCRRP